MIEKISLVFLLVACASASNFEGVLRSRQFPNTVFSYSSEFLARFRSERSFADNPCSGRSGTHFARNNRGCAWYYACNSDNQVIREDRCPDGLRFDYDDQKCDFVENVTCSIDDDRNVPQNCPTGRGISVIPHLYSCSKYTVCFDGIINDRECPAGLHFSYYDGTCVTPFLADCDLDKILCQDSIATGVPVLVPNSRDCGSYYVCVGSTSVPLRCSPNQHFLPEQQWCVPEIESDCDPSIPEDGPRVPDVISVDCGGETGVTLPHPESCNFYFFCAGDRSYLQVCGEGLIYDINTARCQSTGKCVLDEEIATEPPIIIDP